MEFRRIGHKILVVVGIAVTVGLLATAAFYTRHQENTVLSQNERTMRNLTDSVIQALQSVMLAGYADIAQAFADRLKKVPEVADFRILRADGTEAFRDNKTIHDVNKRRGEDLFLPREAEERHEVLPESSPLIARALSSKEPVAVYESDAQGQRVLTFIAPIVNHEPCYKCHGKANPVRGLLKLTTSLAPVERDVLRGRQQSLIVVGLALMATMLLTGYMIGRSVVKPLQSVTEAMARVSGGDLAHRVPVEGRDELSQMASSFNVMTQQLEQTYDGLRMEQDKLTTIIFSAGEGMVVTDSHGTVVLVNPAAEQLLGKSVDQIRHRGFLNILDDPQTMARWLQQSDGTPHTVPFRQRVLNVYASTIHNSEGKVVGSAALLRDVTEEKRLEEELRKLSTTDPLTGLFNRRHLDATLEHEIERAKRYALPLSVLMCDIDHFKRFNDEHGHEMGDRILVGVARILRGALRNNDVACRFGGEEFLAILPSTSQAGAYAVAERLRRDIEEAELEGLRVTVSVGLASLPELAAAHPDQLVEAADRALYQAKQAGRNRVRVAERS